MKMAYAPSDNVNKTSAGSLYNATMHTFFFVSPQINDRVKNKLLPSANDRLRSCSTSLPASAYKSWSEETASPIPLPSQRQMTFLATVTAQVRQRPN